MTIFLRMKDIAFASATNIVSVNDDGRPQRIRTNEISEQSSVLLSINGFLFLCDPTDPNSFAEIRCGSWIYSLRGVFTFRTFAPRERSKPKIMRNVLLMITNRYDTNIYSKCVREQGKEIGNHNSS